MTKAEKIKALFHDVNIHVFGKHFCGFSDQGLDYGLYVYENRWDYVDYGIFSGAKANSGVYRFYGIDPSLLSEYEV